MKEEAVIWHSLNNAVTAGISAGLISSTGLLTASWKAEFGWQQFFMVTGLACSIANRKLVKDGYTITRGISDEIEGRGIGQIAEVVDEGGIPALPYHRHEQRHESFPVRRYAVAPRQVQVSDADETEEHTSAVSVPPTRNKGSGNSKQESRKVVEERYLQSAASADYEDETLTSTATDAVLPPPPSPQLVVAALSPPPLPSTSLAIQQIPAYTSTKPPSTLEEKAKDENQEMEKHLIKALMTYGISRPTWEGAIKGPAFIRCLLRTTSPLKNIQKCSQDIQRVLAEYVEMGEGGINIGQERKYVTIDIPRKDREFCPLSKFIAFNPQPVTDKLLMAVGVNLSGELQNINFRDTPHWLVGGAPGGGKSELLRMGILSLCYRYHPDWISIIIGDPKLVTFSEYENLPWIKRIVETNDEMVDSFEEYVSNLKERYKILKKYGVQNIWQYNQKFAATEGIMKYNFYVIDEFAEAIVGSGRKRIEDSAKTGAALGRASGDIIVLATQRPSAEVVTPMIRSNIEGRIGLRTSSEGDSHIIFGAEVPDARYLSGKGDLLLAGKTGTLERLQSPYIQEEDFQIIRNWLNPPVQAEAILVTHSTVDEKPVEESNEVSAQVGFSEKEKEQLIALAHKLGWLNSSKVISGVWSIRKSGKTAEDIRNGFKALVAEGLGELRGENEQLEWCLNSQQPVSGENSQPPQLLAAQASGVPETTS